MLEPILVEDSTPTKLVPSLEGILKDLKEDATHHDYFVALLIVFLAESGFYISSSNKNYPQWFKDNLVTPVRTDLLIKSELMGPSLQCLPTELILKILSMLSVEDVTRMAQCCSKFHGFLTKSLPNELTRTK